MMNISDWSSHDASVSQAIVLRHLMQLFRATLSNDTLLQKGRRRDLFVSPPDFFISGFILSDGSPSAL
jgi:DNA-binding transcriptional regulator GbsR (MarR family)